ncbi:hypothetical protein EXIGLDRAFT_674411 [Exidia glandulosa HHB12029]|uniref:Uncharacterized protein n=1 Tax=Exidia glandulosa HHB12029 TaxID=1314781 RepID=A0A165I9J6_EXIGL|nr:hypothetical protein EXIGLDRAFT_674411 [Exidia glandulosa HHB12029]
MATHDAGLKILTSPPVFDALYEFCGPGTLCRVAKTCNGAHQAVDNYLTHTLSATTQLARFFGQDALEFRRLQAELQFIISGSQALQLLERTVYPKSDLDIYVFPLDAEVLGRWILARGYEFTHWHGNGIPDHTVAGLAFAAALAGMPDLIDTDIPHNPPARDWYDIPHVRAVFNFEKRVPGLAEGDDDTRQVQIIVADITPVQAVLGFHATMVMNFITWDRVFSLYPAGTFERRRAVVTYSEDRHFGKAMIKYAARGFRIDSTLFDDEAQRGLFKFGPRWVGDSHCWVVKLDTTGIDPPAFPVQWEVNSWELGHHSEHDPRDMFGECAIKSTPLRSVIFRHRYCVMDEFYQYILIRVLRPQGRIEFERMQAMDLTPGIGLGYGQARPDGFEYRDEDLPRYKESFLQAMAYKR